jgi:hypothetical protein
MPVLYGWPIESTTRNRPITVPVWAPLEVGKHVQNDLGEHIETTSAARPLCGIDIQPDSRLFGAEGIYAAVGFSNPRSSKTFLATNVASRAFGMPQ